MEIETDDLRALFDLVTGSLEFGSGFLELSDVVLLRKVARMLGVDEAEGTPESDRRRFPHLWRQSCALKYMCGLPQNDPIHRVELPK